MKGQVLLLLGGAQGRLLRTSYGRRAVATAKWAAMQISADGKGLRRVRLRVYRMDPAPARTTWPTVASLPKDSGGSAQPPSIFLVSKLAIFSSKVSVSPSFIINFVH